MQLPFAKLLGLASGAVGLVQKAFTNKSGNTDFDTELTQALTGKTTTDKKGLMKMLSDKGILDEDVLEGLMGCSSGMALFKFMAELKKIGISPKDMGCLLGGDASKVSDDALKDLLTSFGFGKAELEKVLSDTNLKTRIKESLADSLKEVLQTQAQKEGLDPEVMVKLATVDAATVEKLIETSKTSFNHSAVLENVPMSSSQAAAEIREMIAKALKISGDGVSTAQVTGKASTASTASSAENMIQVAGKSFDISRETLNVLFSATDLSHYICAKSYHVLFLTHYCDTEGKAEKGNAGKYARKSWENNWQSCYDTNCVQIMCLGVFNICVVFATHGMT